MFNKRKSNKGFTLVELLVVIAIIGILAVVAVPSLFNNIQKSKVAKLEANISAIKSAAAVYYADNNAYPANESEATTVFEDELDDISAPFGVTAYKLQGNATTPTDLTMVVTTTDLINPAGHKKLKADFGDLYIGDVPQAASNTFTITLIDANK